MPNVKCQNVDICGHMACKTFFSAFPITIHSAEWLTQAQNLVDVENRTIAYRRK